jgi:hypothetical protein
MPDAELLIGSLDSQYLLVRPLNRSQSEDYWDGNWMNALVELAVGAFRGRFTANLRTDEFARFRSELESLYDSLSGSAEFHSMEEWLTIRFTGDARGHFDIRCTVRDQAGVGNTLTFALAIDQTQLPAVLRALRDIEEAWPVVGDPSV